MYTNKLIHWKCKCRQTTALYICTKAKDFPMSNSRMPERFIYLITGGSVYDNTKNTMLVDISPVSSQTLWQIILNV